MVKNIRLEALSPTAVMVSWDSVDIPEVTNYIVYYTETGSMKRKGISVESPATSVDIEGLSENVTYQFEVMVKAEVKGLVFFGARSPPSSKVYEIKEQEIGENYVSSNDTIIY